MQIIISRILIIAEEKQVVDALLEFFESHAYEAEIALNEKIAINIINERKMDVVLVGFKDENPLNLEIIENIRASNSIIPIIVMGGEKSKRTENKVIKAGAQVFVPDPVENEVLLNEVKRISSRD